jgi:hypothetical protein
MTLRTGEAVGDMIEEAVDRTMWIVRFGIGFGPVVR